MIPGFPDLVGYQTVTITQDMVGQKIAEMIMPEIKQLKGKKGEAQIRFQTQALKMGVKYKFCRSVKDFRDMLR